MDIVAGDGSRRRSSGHDNDDGVNDDADVFKFMNFYWWWWWFSRLCSSW